MTKLLAVALGLTLTVPAGANGVDVWIQDTGGGTYAVKARLAADSLTNNAGFAAMSISLIGAGTIVNTLPRVDWVSGGSHPVTYPVAGFTLYRSGTGTIPDNPIQGFQNTGSGESPPVIYGLGIGTVDMGQQLPPRAVAGRIRTLRRKSFPAPSRWGTAPTAATSRGSAPTAGFRYSTRAGTGMYSTSIAGTRFPNPRPRC